MNKKRKNLIQRIIAKLQSCSTELADVNFEESYARESIPANLQESDNYRKSEDCSEKIEDAIDNIQCSITTLQDI